jgi:peptidoglycan/LPS O-acetylase OafA/YrhL
MQIPILARLRRMFFHSRLSNAPKRFDTASASAVGFQLGHEPSLDGLRGIAVLCVMFAHLSLLGAGADLNANGSSGLWGLKGGFLGVDIFFVLSGFLITSLLLKEQQRKGWIGLKAFYGRRALRLLPALALVLGACCLYILLHFDAAAVHPVKWGVLMTLSCGANTYYWVRGAGLGMLTHVWSLSIEEKFYFIWPVLLCTMLRRQVRRRGMLLIVLAGIAASTLLRVACWGSGTNFVDRIAQCSLPARADNLLIGCLLAMIAGWGRLPRSRTGRALLRMAAWAAAAMLANLLWNGMPGPWTYLITGVVTALLIAGLIGGKPSLLRAVLATKPLAWIGQVSYGLYLWHVPVFALAPLVLYRFVGRSEQSIQIGCAIGFGLTFAVAAASYYFVERPFLRWKSRLANG